MKPLLVVGDALLDRDVSGRVTRVCPDAPVPVLDEQTIEVRPGGAALAAVLAASDGREVTLLAAVGQDEAGCELARLLAASSVELIDLGLHGPTPEKVRLRAAGQSLLRLDRGAEVSPIGEFGAAGRAAIGWAEAILVADYGRGMAAHPAVRSALTAAAGHKPIVWDPHVRGPAPVERVELATPNEHEARAFLAHAGLAPEEQAAALAARWRARNVCVTRGAAGALLAPRDGSQCSIPAPRIGAGDPCGAGDRFSSAAAGVLADGRTVLEAAREGVAHASAFVALGGAAAVATPAASKFPSASTPAATLGCEAHTERALALAAQVRAAAGTVVAAGGCFDLLHTGHVALLRAARALGDCLVVCLNSDSSVTRLKGPSRPLVGERDRAAVLSALECVDAVAVFGESTPVALLERLRPDVWAKGGDYAAHELPERAALERWGGRVVTLPYLEGHSTTGLIEEVACHVAS